MEGLTERQVRILGFIGSYQAGAGYPPCIREIGAAMRIGTLRGVTGHLDALARKGYVERSKGVARGIRLTPPGRRVARGQAETKPRTRAREHSGARRRTSGAEP
jgi:SOS-response transcriptional repressor LexA